MDTIKEAIQSLKKNSREKSNQTPITFERFLEKLIERPETVLRNIFQVFHDLVTSSLGTGVDEYPNDPESIQFVKYDCDKLFVNGSDHPFFADRLFANRFVNAVKALKRGAQQNMIYIFKGPPGCGKSTFLNNLLLRFEEYANTEEGVRYETIWRFSRKNMRNLPAQDNNSISDKLMQLLELKSISPDLKLFSQQNKVHNSFNEYIDIPCPSHDHPILLIPKKDRQEFLSKLLGNNPFLDTLYSKMEYDWIFNTTPCTICSSMYRVLLEYYGAPDKVFEIIHARPYFTNRQLGEGVSIFNPGDEPISQKVHQDPFIQRRLNFIINDSNKVKYLFSHYAKTNNGIYALMDIKSNNTNRLIELHNIVSEGLHKVEEIEENVSSLLIAVMNPEDQKNIQSFKSFSDRIVYINVPYVMDLNTEVEIYRNTFGKNIDKSFLPRVLRNFARVIISTRINSQSKALFEVVQEPEKYKPYCDKNLNLLKMEFYTGRIPDWLTEEDRKRLTAKLRQRIISESELEGDRGISGRDSIRLFNEFYSSFSTENQLITMSDLVKYFTTSHNDLHKIVSQDFLDSLVQLYNFTVLHEVKESLYYFNKAQISKDIQNYLFAINFEAGSNEKCTFTGDRLEITEEFFESIEKRIFGKMLSKDRHRVFREETQREYATRTLTQEIMIDVTHITNTDIYNSLFERYLYNIKEKALDPFLENENFRRGIKDYGDTEFKTYDKRIQDDIKYLIQNLCDKFNYTEQGAKEMCMYVIDNDLAKKFERHR